MRVWCLTRSLEYPASSVLLLLFGPMLPGPGAHVLRVCARGRVCALACARAVCVSCVCACSRAAVPSWQVIALQTNPESKQQSFMQRLSGYPRQPSLSRLPVFPLPSPPPAPPPLSLLAPSVSGPCSRDKCACMCACVRLCVCVRVRVRVRVCAHACACVHVRARVRACGWMQAAADVVRVGGQEREATPDVRGLHARRRQDARVLPHKGRLCHTPLV